MQNCDKHYEKKHIAHENMPVSSFQFLGLKQINKHTKYFLRPFINFTPTVPIHLYPVVHQPPFSVPSNCLRKHPVQAGTMFCHLVLLHNNYFKELGGSLHKISKDIIRALQHLSTLQIPQPLALPHFLNVLQGST